MLLLLLSRVSRVRLCATPYGSPPGPPAPGILQTRSLDWVAMPLSNGTFPTQGLNLQFLHWQQILYH